MLPSKLIYKHHAGTCIYDIFKYKNCICMEYTLCHNPQGRIPALPPQCSSELLLRHPIEMPIKSFPLTW